MHNMREAWQNNRWLYVIAVFVVVVVYIVWCLVRSLPSLQPAINAAALSTKTPASTLQWPTPGQSAVGILNSSIMETHGNQQPVPIASTAKLITALTVLGEKPLALGQQGPTITITPADVAIYNNYVSEDGSLVQVQAGEQISEYQMLQAMLLPSANNMADSLAIWAFGSLNNYQQAANQSLESQGIVETHVGSDASGFNPSTTSTARDLVKIGELAMQNPVLAQIVGQSAASGIPVVGNVKNVNSLLGTNGIVGIKTGNTDQAGGVFVSASKTNVNDKQVTIVTAYAAAPGLWQAMSNSLPLIKSAQTNFKPVTFVKNGTAVADYKQPWGGQVSAVATNGITYDAWADGNTINAKTTLKNISASSNTSDLVGNAVVQASAYNNRLSAPVKLQNAPKQPTIGWRLTHPF
jgi:D-alanyl-D-alanine carboxypeptidase (penicillin-binding protein 5/6)